MTELISLVSKTTPEELKEMAETFRNLADDIENGHIQAAAYVAIAAASDTFDRGWVKTAKITTTELIGAMFTLMYKMSERVDPDT